MIGKGVTEFVGLNIGSMAIETGYTASLGNASGMASGTNGEVSVTYRGVENGWGNIWEWLDGFNIYRDSTKNQHDLYYADHGYADDTGSTPYKKFNATLCQKDGYVSAFAYEADGDMDCLFIASETRGSTNWGLCDYFYRSASYTGWLAALLGASWSDGSGAGAGCLSVSHAASSNLGDAGARVLYVPDGNGEHKE